MKGRLAGVNGGAEWETISDVNWGVDLRALSLSCIGQTLGSVNRFNAALAGRCRLQSGRGEEVGLALTCGARWDTRGITPVGGYRADLLADRLECIQSFNVVIAQTVKMSICLNLSV